MKLQYMSFRLITHRMLSISSQFYEEWNEHSHAFHRYHQIRVDLQRLKLCQKWVSLSFVRQIETIGGMLPHRKSLAPLELALIRKYLSSSEMLPLDFEVLIEHAVHRFWKHSVWFAIVVVRSSVVLVIRDCPIFYVEKSEVYLVSLV